MKTTDYCCMAGAVTVWAVSLYFGFFWKVMLVAFVVFIALSLIRRDET